MKSSNQFIGYAIRLGSLIFLITSATNALGFKSLGTNVDNTCAGLGYPLDAQFQPSVSSDCMACHDDGSGGSGDGKTAYQQSNWEFFCPAPPSNLPPIAEANGPYSAEFGKAISFSSTGSSDPDGTITSYLWDFGDGATSMNPNPTHAYSAASEYDVSLTVTDGMGESDMSSTTASVTPIAVDDPDIGVADAMLDFHQIEIGTTATLTTVVENTGTQLLSIDSIMGCIGTGGEFTWSPSAFEVMPGASQILSVLYSPMDELADSGCIEIFSNDPDENPATLAVNGAGFIPTPQVADLDITSVRSSRRIRLGQRTKPVTVKVILINDGFSQADGSAGLTGTQQGQVVYENQTAISVAPGERRIVTFPGFVPSAAGEIEWHVSVTDEDPDVDEATTMTRVTMGKQR